MCFIVAHPSGNTHCQVFEIILTGAKLKDYEKVK